MPDQPSDYPLNALPRGHLLQGEYRIEQLLGAGGFGLTYLSTDGFGRPVAIKEYLPNELAVRVAGATQVSARSGQDSDDFQWGLRKFREEGAKLAAFDHPNINRVLRLFEANGTAYLVLEYVHGRTLSKLLAEGDRHLPSRELERLLAEMLEALSVVHDAGLVHCDIKPANIILRHDDGKAVLLDFGASRQAVSQRTKSATSAFTPPYSALEQYEQESPDLGPWTDLYGLGMVAYRCVSGRAELDLPEAVTRAKWQRRGQLELDIPPASQVGAGRYPQPLLNAIDWALALEENNRPQSAQAMAEAMGVELDEEIEEPLPPPPTPPTPPQPQPQPPPSPPQPPPSPPQTPPAPPSPPSGQVKKRRLALVGLLGLAVIGFAAFRSQEERAQEDTSWELCKNGRTQVPCDDYLRQWEEGRYADLARTRLRDLEAAARAAAEAESAARAAAEAAALAAAEASARAASEAEARAAAESAARAAADASAACPDLSQRGIPLTYAAGELYVQKEHRVTPGAEIRLDRCNAVRGNGSVSRAPSFTLSYTGNTMALEFRVVSDCDSTLLVNDPNEVWRFDDDSNGNIDPKIRVPAAPTGRWDIWVGKISDRACSAKLIIETFTAESSASNAQAEAERRAAAERQRLRDEAERSTRRVELCNRTNAVLFAAVGRQQAGQWFASGWWQVPQGPSECVTLTFRSDGPLVVHAKSPNGDTFVGAQNRGKLCISPTAPFTDLVNETCNQAAGNLLVDFGRETEGANGLQRFSFVNQ